VIKGFTWIAALILAAGPLLPSSVRAESDAELAKKLQNPIANLISLPLQSNWDWGIGQHGTDAMRYTLNVQPVIPFSLTKDWNLITRTIVPAISQPPLFAADNRTNGIGATQFSAFLSPSNAEGTIWGAGPIVQIPTTSDSALGSYRWGLGPTFVVLKLEKGSPWVYGFLVNNVWSVGNGAGGSYNNFLLQPFVNYNFEGGTYLTTGPILTADWKADSGNQWTVPLGGGIGHIFHLGRLPVNTQVSAYYNVVKPDFGPNWQIRAQVQLMFPK
jgi:hypothetical protein